MKIIQEETFGPIATIQVFDTIEEAIELANDSLYGLAASVWSQDVDLPLRVVRELRVGTVWINSWAQVNDEFEEGGFKFSGVGRLNGLAAMQEFIEYKHIFQHAGILKKNNSSNKEGLYFLKERKNEITIRFRDQGIILKTKSNTSKAE